MILSGFWEPVRNPSRITCDVGFVVGKQILQYNGYTTQLYMQFYKNS